ncbi:hypothetical protein SAMD00019534_087040 [Acytostelium subglobosum LB1]|uniref:hypothetical protein n=1 Tax=Acytostelium subglobosum LB1 TaxID=1410327 RepID=UPI000644975C|nr:hypothetical protein SAMD00019534_087040 [Acytostelium subglobosum LB1]GAM25529.1 hypothetical protein SAMD00019534_087040 [Acytostelium subglobosum LB1]|eukprot:XP_012751515.1 hypothetical protein SAMD00019534_087040 [Acytostelium subglobosum LB1]
MDKQLNDVLTQCSSTNGVIGMVCVDESGLCLKATGSANASTAGYYRALIEKGKLLKNETPNITIETDSSNIFIQETDKVTFALHKLP